MKTFTTCAEKKAKQFFNLLQGYTKGIRITAILILLLMGVSNAWAAELKNGQYIYIKYGTGNWGSASAKFRFNWYWNVGDWCCYSNEEGRISNDNGSYYAYAKTQNEYTRAVQILRFNSDFSSEWNYTNTVAVSSNTKNCITLTSNVSNNYTFSWSTYAPPMSSVTLENNGTSIVSGSGTSSDPYLVYVGTSIKVKASGEKVVADPDATIYYDFKQGTTSQQNGTSTTYSFTASSTANISYTINLDGYTKISNTNSTKKTATALYFKTIAPTYTVTFGVHSSGNGTLTAKAGSTNISSGDKVSQGSSVTFTATPNPGYQVEGWYSDANCSQKITEAGTSTPYDAGTLTANKTVYVKFEGITYTITLDKQEGTGGTDKVTVQYKNNNYNPATVSAPTRPNYTFGGYYVDTNGGGFQVINESGHWVENAYGYTDGSGNWTRANDITLYAKWTAQAQPDPTHEIYLVGEFNWNAAPENIFTQDSNNPNIYTLTKRFDARDRHQTTTQPQPEYEFKLQVDGVKYTVEDNTDPNTKEKYKKILQYTRQSKTKILSDGTAYNSDPYYNLLLQADFTGDYVFTYNVSTKELTVEHPTYTSEASYIVGDFSDGATGTDPLPKDDGAGHDWTEAYGQTIGTDPNEPICFELGKNSTWEFKIKINGVWYGAENVNITENGEYILTDDYAYMSERNCTITTTDVDGEYCFSYKVNDDGTITLIVGYPDEDEVEDANTVYLKLNNEWEKDNARYAVYYWNDGGHTWKDMEAIDCNGDYYKAEVPEGYSKLIFARMKHNTSNDWNNKDGLQSPDLTLPTDGNNLYDVEKAKYLYLTPNSDWKSDGARFAAYFFGNGEKWVDMKDDDGDGIYTCEKQSGFPQVIFCRMNPAYTGNQWNDNNSSDRVWNQTEDLWIQGDGKDHFTLNAGSWNKGTWAHYSWSTYTAPTYDVTINITGKGSIVIDGTTYTSNSTGTTTEKKTGVEVNTNINVTAITAADRWAKSAATIKIGNDDQEELSTSHSICGPTTINVTFEQTQCVVHLELQLPTGTVHPAIDDQIVDVNTTADKPQVDNIDGYIFAGWYTDEACSIGNEYDFTKPVTQDITLYAKWVPYENCIFFKNNLNWDEVYVYFYSSDKYWDDWYGTGSQKEKELNGGKAHYRGFRGKMTQIGLTDIWYFDYISAAKVIDLTNWAEIKESKNVVFTQHEQYDKEWFWKTSVIRRGDFNKNLALYIPEDRKTANHNDCAYYNSGLWMKYNDTYSGYDWSGQTGGSSNWSDKQLTSALAGGYSFTAEVELTANKDYEFKIKNLNNTWYGNTGTMTQDNCTDWWFTENTKNATITPTVTGTYIFTVYLGDGKVMVSLDYPLSVGDYRLAYKDSQAGSFHPGHYIKKRTKVEEKRDTVSFFVVYDKTPEIQLQECTDITSEGIAKWGTIATYSNINSVATATTVYNFILKQTNINDTHARSVETSETHLYTGDYYIRTDAAAGGWKSFRQEGNKMTYNSYADEHEDFDHYFCEWVSQEKGLKNVSYTVANDYSYCISDTLHDDVDTNHPIIVSNIDLDKKGNLPVKNGTLRNANVRWGWDSKTNKIRRAYIAGSGHKKDRFLVLEGNASLQDVNGKRFTGQTAEGQDRYNLTDDEVVFEDMGNWIYQIDVKANKDTKIDLTALYDGKVQYFKGGSKDDDEILLIVTTNDNEKYYKIRIIYDFKTNHLISAWLPEDETITTDEQLGADMMIIRHNQEKAEQLNFNPLSSSLTKVGTAYAVMTFDKYFLNNKDKTTGLSLSGDKQNSDYARALYWISFPFDVKLSEVFGFGEYGDYWIMEYYDGAARAKNGLWADTDTYWKYITNKNYILQKGQGYVISLNLNKMGFTSSIFANTTEVSLYFPSHGELGTITGELPANVIVPAHECTIEREEGIHKIYDSHWNVIGVPGFADIENVEVGNHLFVQDSLYFYYEYLPQTNEYRTKRANNKADFQTMYSYMVQYHGGINWRTKTFNGPAEIAARRTGDMPSQYDLRLELAIDDQLHDQTFLLLDEDKRATAEYDVNLDLTKIMNKNASIYTLAGEQRITLSGNTLPMDKATVPVGVRIATAGEYTFRMPDGTDGISVFLIDNQTGAQTNMLLDEYTITLDAGTCENRFYLAVDPDRTATAVENIGEDAKGEEAKGVEKFLIDGQLFIRTADGTFDAKGQRL